jgi:precorrin-4/cobalt-precorrin-4 C11-methyltransferase
MNETTIIFLGAGPGDPELMTIRGQRLLAQADTVVYAGSLVSKASLEFCPQAELVDSAPLCLDDIVKIMVTRAREGKRVIRLHSGDPSLYGAIKEQITRLRQQSMSFEVVPGVTSLSAASAALASELTVPEVSQTVIITRAAGRTPVPELEDIGSLAAHHATMAIFLSAGLVDEVQKKLLLGYPPDTPVAVVHNASRPDQKILRTTVEKLPADLAASGIDRTAIILVGAALAQEGEESLLYREGFSHGCRE